MTHTELNKLLDECWSDSPEIVQCDYDANKYFWVYRCNQSEENFDSPIKALIDFCKEQQQAMDTICTWKPQ